MRSRVSRGIDAPAGEPLSTNDRVVGDSFKCFARAFRLTPALFGSGTEGVSHKARAGRKSNGLEKRFIGPIDAKSLLTRYFQIFYAANQVKRFTETGLACRRSKAQTTGVCP